MKIKPDANTAESIPVLAETDAGAPGAVAPGEGPLTSKVTKYRVDLAYVRLDYEISGPAYVQLSYSAYPYLTVYLDGQPTPYFSTALHLIGLATPAGAHRIELRPFLSPVRVAAFAVDVAGGLAIALLAVYAGRRARHTQ
jgi:hypothetical protein